MRWITLGVGAALGYLLGSAEGRQNLDKMTKNAQKLWNDPKTQEKVSKVQEQAQNKFADVKGSDTVQEAASKVTQAVKGGSDHKHNSTNPQSGAAGTQETTISNDDHVQAPNATGADPDIISDPSTPLGDEGPTAR